MKKDNVKKLEQLCNESGEVYFRMALSEVVRIGYDHLKNTTEEELRIILDKVKEDEKPNEIMTADFKIMIMQLEHDIVNSADIWDILMFVKKLKISY